MNCPLQISKNITYLSNLKFRESDTKSSSLDSALRHLTPVYVFATWFSKNISKIFYPSRSPNIHFKQSSCLHRASMTIKHFITQLMNNI